MKRASRMLKHILTVLSMLLMLAASTLSYAAPPDSTLRTVLPEGGGKATPTTDATIDSLRVLAESIFDEALAPYYGQLAGVNLSLYDNVALQRDVFFRMSEVLGQCFLRFYIEAVQVVCQDLRQINIPLAAVTRERTELNWQEAASLYRAFGQDTAASLARGLHLALPVSGGSARFECSFAENDVMFAAGTREQLLAARFTLSYLYTVYDDAGVRAAYETPALPADYLATLAHPLPGATIKNGWYNPRSRRTRLHTGTDIRARRGTEILSVTDGVVLYIGFSAIPGYYVIIRDPSGYEYHYYHMVRQSEHVTEGEAVRQGQPIGLVGSTGNSEANHLHLAIVTPEGAYINPYDVFVQAGVGPIRP